jgi:multicomponent Na+:H+ antiporter subunit B
MSHTAGRDLHGMTIIVKSVTRIVAAFIMLFGATVVMYGHVTPGGGFAGGVIIAEAFVLIVLAFGKGFAGRFVTGTTASVWDSSAAVAFLGVGLMGYLGGCFFWNFLRPPPGAHMALFRLYSAGSILLSNVAIGLKVGMGLLGVFLALSVFRPTRTEGGDHE